MPIVYEADDKSVIYVSEPYDASDVEGFDEVVEVEYAFSDRRYRNNPQIDYYYCRDEDEWYAHTNWGDMYKVNIDIFKQVRDHPARIINAMQELGLLDEDKKYRYIREDEYIVEIDESYASPYYYYPTATEWIEKTVDGEYVKIYSSRWQGSPDYTAKFIRELEDMPQVVASYGNVVVYDRDPTGEELEILKDLGWDYDVLEEIIDFVDGGFGKIYRTEKGFKVIVY